MNYKRFLPILLIVFSVTVLTLSFFIEGIHYGKQQNSLHVVQSNGISFEIADTAEKRILGLSGRENIPSDYGMLFIFPEKGNYGFWMKDMKEPIDILWLADDGEILKIDANVSPDSYPESFHPPAPVRHVLEMKANEASRKGYIVGAKIPLPLSWFKINKLL